MSMTAAATEAAREQMIQQQLRAWDVLDQEILGVFARVPRELFVPEAYAELAFADVEIPLGGGDRMLAPKVAGRIVQAVALKPTDRALLVGVGTGYLAACLGARACSVRGLEVREDLAALAKRNLAAAGVRNVGVEAFQLRVSAFDTHQQRVEAVDQWPEFERLSRSVQPQPCPSQSDRVHLCGQFLHRQKASADQQEPRHADDARTDE